MKRTILSLTLALMASCVFGQTVEKLFEKYKAMPQVGSEYTTVDVSKEVEESSKQKLEDGDAAPNAMLTDVTLTGFKTGELLQLTLNDEQKQELAKDLLSLKGYNMLFEMNKNPEQKEDTTSILSYMVGKLNQMFSPQYELTAYGKEKGKMVNDILIVWDIWNTTVLGHFEGKMKKERFIKALTNDTFALYSSGHEEGEVVRMTDVAEDVKNGKVLYVINGEVHPECQSIDEAREYMISNNIHWNSESWIVGAAVKEKYPDTDMKVVVEWSEKDLTEKEEEHEKR